MASNYIDKIMSNHVFNSESSDNLQYLYENKKKKSKKIKNYKILGGDTYNDEDKPNGGFPQIYIIDKPLNTDEEQNKNRGLAGKKIGISIKDILSSKK